MPQRTKDQNYGAPLYVEQAKLVLAQPLPGGMLVPLARQLGGC